MAKNGNLWKVITIVLKIVTIVAGVIIVTGGIIYGYATLEHQVSDNAEMQPEVKLNTEHRIKFEEKVDNMADDVAEIRRILEK